MSTQTVDQLFSTLLLTFPTAEYVKQTIQPELGSKQPALVRSFRVCLRW
jgi:hypothetical protein